MKCPKCSYERTAIDTAPAWQCPACKVAYSKAMRASSSPNAPTARVAPAPQLEIDEDERLWLAARGQKIAIYCILINFGLRGLEQSKPLPEMVLLILSIIVGIYALIGVVKICSGLQKSQNTKIAMMVASFIPLVNVVTLVYLSVKATKLLRSAGWQVGLLGARP